MAHEIIIRVLIADDHPMMREGLRSTLEIERDMKIVGEVADGAEAVESFARLRPDVVIMDLQMPRYDGAYAIEAIRSACPDASIVVLTTYLGDARVSRAMALGATSYLLKTASSDEIVATVRSAFVGRSHISPNALEDMGAHRGAEPLSTRELAVLRLASQGLGNREIGEELSLAEETVKTRMKSILAKLHANDRTHAVTIAIVRGFLDVS
ncbi:LuxR family two component transcriptional regulator [Luteibacter sp. OK325]|jgi:DNA-binding NarL/FixJ family response regulator|uniref:response regulator transcription factor n=1 Tax=Luteibacter sp. OK325 TaxID=2135670 RepID=UPI000D37C9B7|nr:response regulator transcription factor [Luteibacter sp. OK325]PTR34437.1 LuxR family two component transcriptional regulator [Luteibacter sp. OK325]